MTINVKGQANACPFIMSISLEYLYSDNGMLDFLCWIEVINLDEVLFFPNGFHGKKNVIVICIALDIID